MKESHYFELISEAYLETVFLVESNLKGDHLHEERKKLFRQNLIRRQKITKKKYYVTKDEFLFQCKRAIDRLDKYCQYQINSINKDLLTDTELRSFNNGYYGVRMSPLIPETVDKSNSEIIYTDTYLSINDIEIIKECFENFNFDKVVKIEDKPGQKSKKTIMDFIHRVKDKKNFLENLKELFPTEKGKSMKIIIKLLEKEGILIIGSREFNEFYNALKSFMCRDIGSYPSINDVKFEGIDAVTIEPILKKVNLLLISCLID